MRMLWVAALLLAGAAAFSGRPLTPVRQAWRAVPVQQQPASRRQAVQCIAWGVRRGRQSTVAGRFISSTLSFIRESTRRSRKKSKKEKDEENKLAVLKAEREWTALGKLASMDMAVLVISTVSLVAAALCDIAAPHYSAKALSMVIGGDRSAFAGAMRGLIAFSVGSAIFTGLRGAFFWIAGARVVTRLRQKLFANMLRQEVAFFDQHETGELTSRISADAAKLANVVSFHVNIIVRQAIQALGGIIYLFFLNWRLAMVSLGGLLLTSLVSAVNGAFSRWLSVQAALPTLPPLGLLLNTR